MGANEAYRKKPVLRRRLQLSRRRWTSRLFFSPAAAKSIMSANEDDENEDEMPDQEDETYLEGAAASATAAAAAAADSGSGEGQQKSGKYKTGKFTKEETEIVKASVHRYCAAKQISVARLCSECDHKAELKGAWMEIAKDLPQRSVQSVYRHGLRQLHPFKRGKWTEEECDILMHQVDILGKKWALIQIKLNRSADSCRDKYREMDESFSRGRWKERETEQLKQLIRAHLKVHPNASIEELGRIVESEGIRIPWSTISKQMEKRSRLSCFKKWQKMTMGENKPLARKTKKDDDMGAATYASGDGGEMIAPPLHTHDAPTAGAAAALAASANLHHTTHNDFDLLLLNELASLQAKRTSDIDWDDIKSVDNPQERWNELVEELQSSTSIDEELLTLPLSEMAQLILDQKSSAQRAAETVEAVELPRLEV